MEGARVSLLKCSLVVVEMKAICLQLQVCLTSPLLSRDAASSGVSTYILPHIFSIYEIC